MTMLPEESTLNSTEPIYVYPVGYQNQHHAAVIASIYIIIGIAGIIGNCLVFTAMSFSRKLQTPTNAFVLSLSISDFITALTLPLHGVGVLSEEGWPHPEWVCNLNGVVSMLSNSASFLAMMAIAVNRYVLITKSKSLYRRIYSRQGVALSLALMWLFAFLAFSFPQLIPSLGATKYNPIFSLCGWDITHNMTMVVEIIAGITFFICTITIIFCYLAIYIFVRRFKAQMKIRYNNQQLEAASGGQPNSSSAGLSVKEINITKNLATVVLVFFICYMPNLVGVGMQYIVMAYLGFLIYLPVCLNPVIYAAKHPNFKVVFRCLLTCRLRDIPLPSRLLKAIIHLASANPDATRASQPTLTTH